MIGTESLPNETSIFELTTDQEFKNLIPPLSQEEYNGLEISILNEGCRDALVVWNGVIVDGHNRYEICKKHGLPYKVNYEILKDYIDRDDVIEWIYNNQLSRRNLTDEQRSYLRGMQYKHQKKAKGGRADRIFWGAQNDPPKTAETVGNDHGVSSATIKRDEKYADAINKIADSCGNVIKEKILTREIDASKRVIVNIAALPADQLKAVFEKVASGEASTLTHAQKTINHEGTVLHSTASGKYRVIYADPPWYYGNRMDEAISGSTVPETYYPCMNTADICNYSLPEIDDNAVLFLWVTSPLLEDGLKVINAWGFKYKTSFVWDKILHNMGHYNSVRHEFLLIATKGSCTPDVKKLFDSVVTIERTDHSRKPEYFREIIETLYPEGKRIEIFARIQQEGWDVIGNQLP